MANTEFSSGSGSGGCIYLDYNGTTPVYPEVVESMLPYLMEHFGNPSSSHAFGTEPRRAIANARKQILTELLGAGEDEDPSAIWFTGCGTESDNLAIRLALECTTSASKDNSNSNSNKPRHVVTSNVEHPAIEQYLRCLEDRNEIRVTRVPVDKEGRVAAGDVLSAISDDTVLVTLMLANNESGALQPVREVAEECRRRGILVHTDAAQAAGKVSVRLRDTGCPDMVTIVGHKIGAPKGIAALYVRPGCLDETEHGRDLSGRNARKSGIVLVGGGQESGMRGGTENTPYIVGLGTAASMAAANLSRTAAHTEALRSRLLSHLERSLGEDRVRPNGPADASLRLPNTLSVGIAGVRSGALLASVGDAVAASAGAACHSSGGGGESVSVSAVLLAMGVPLDFARGTLRLSVGPGTTVAEIDAAAEILTGAALAQWEEEENRTAAQ
eukprot:jgi/Psemu1/299487/fgenesh1_pm.1592_\